MMVLPLNWRQDGALRSALDAALMDRGNWPTNTYLALQEVRNQLSLATPLDGTLAVVISVRDLDEAQSVMDDIIDTIDTVVAADMRILEG